jgi:pimeloyl-ACP methyl ester carboxylesterase
MTARLVEIAAADGTVLRGQLWPGDAYWVVLLHDIGGDQDLDAWRPLAPSLTARGVTVLAVDLRGHGASDGLWDTGAAAGDAAAVLSYARAGGALGLTVVAAGASAETALRIAPSARVDGLVLLSPPAVDPARVAELRAPGVAKLFVVGTADAALDQTTSGLRNASIGWALAVGLPTAEQGTALLGGPWASQVGEKVLGFVGERRYLARKATAIPQATETSTNRQSGTGPGVED